MDRAGVGRRGVLGAAGLLLASSVSAFAAAKPRVAIVTGKGTIVVELEAEKAPITSTNFLRYVDAKKYDGGSFYRAARTPGAPKEGTIVGGPAPKTHPFPPIAHESTTKTGLRHKEGTLSLGRFDPGSATSTIFICAADEPYLDAHPGAKGDNLGYAAFGQVTDGMAVVHKILASHTGKTAPFPDQKGQWLAPPIAIVSMRRV
jgi:peptidyl-prolyl cis-trans isomerase A (cyclophilin A)